MARTSEPGACPRTGRVGQHSTNCYRSVLSCGKHPHHHNGNACFKQDGSLKCSTAEHAHGGGCYSPEGPNCGGD